MNEKIGNYIVGKASTMGFYWFCVILDSIELFYLLQSPHSIIEWVDFMAQTVIQLQMLPLLSIQNDKTMKKVEQILEIIQKEEEKELEEISEILEIVQK